MTRPHLHLLSLLLAGSASASAFAVPSVVGAGRPSTRLAGVNPNESRDVDPNNIFQTSFSGGAFANQEAEAAKIASRFKSVKDLGWTGPARRRGGARPRHRAYGGSTEQPVQLKPNYDETKENCVEKWLTQEEFYAKAKDSSPAADTVFVALAGGYAFAEREKCEGIIAKWRSGGSRGDAFDEDQFLRSVNAGRTELAAGWALFLSINFFFASCIVFPTNPLAKGLENAISQLQEQVLS